MTENITGVPVNNPEQKPQLIDQIISILTISILAEMNDHEVFRTEPHQIKWNERFSNKISMVVIAKSMQLLDTLLTQTLSINFRIILSTSQVILTPTCCIVPLFKI